MPTDRYFLAQTALYREVHMDERHESRDPNDRGDAVGCGDKVAAFSTPGTSGDPARDAEGPCAPEAAEPEVYPDDADYEPLLPPPGGHDDPPLVVSPAPTPKGAPSMKRPRRTRPTAGRRRKVPVALVLGLALVSALLTPSAARAVPAPAAGPDGKITASLRSTFERSAADRHDFWINFTTHADTSGARDITDWDERGAYVVDHLKQAAKAAQADTIKTLKAAGVHYKAYWVTNAIRVQGGDYGLARALAARPEVKSVFAPVAYK